MARFVSKVKNAKDIRTKSRVYFTSHPDDFDRYFEAVAADIFKTQDCAIYYTEDMTESLTEENLTLDLERMNLVVVPVTLKLLVEDNRAMSVEIPYAIKHGIPILPIMMEDGLVDIYSQKSKFGELQFISPLGGDGTEIDYKSKLENRLLATLTGDELAKRIHDVFDTRIFLSYRKRDRAYANELLKTIHGDGRLRDVAVWYDEFLTPGENYITNIDIALKESSLFILLVTPSVLDDPNFVKDTEYPAAMEAKIPVLPVMMKETDKAELYGKYAELPECVTLDGRLCDRILDLLRPFASADNDGDPERCFLLGVAYSDGVEVELDRERGMELIKYSADAGYEEAIVFLYGIYLSRGNYTGALEYAERYYALCTEKYGADEARIIASVSMLAEAYVNAGRYTDAIPLYEREYKYSKERLGEEHVQTVSAMIKLASARSSAGDYIGALKLHESIYEAQVARHGEKHPTSLHSLAELATAYGNAGDHQRAFELKEKSFLLHSEYYGMASVDGLSALNNYAFAYVQIGENEKACELFDISLSAHSQVLGAEHPDTLNALINLAYTCFMLGERDKGIKLTELALEAMTRVLGEEHPSTIRALDNLAHYHKRSGNLDKSIELNERSLALYKKVLGEEHPSTATSMNNLGNAYVARRDYAKGISLLHSAYLLRARIIGEYHPRTIETLELLANALCKAEDFKQAADAFLLLFSIYLKTRPEGHVDRVVSLYNLSSCHYAVGNKENAIKYMRHAYKEARIGFGDDHPKTKHYKEVLDMLTG